MPKGAHRLARVRIVQYVALVSKQPIRRHLKEVNFMTLRQIEALLYVGASGGHFSVTVPKDATYLPVHQQKRGAHIFAQTKKWYLLFPAYDTTGYFAKPFQETHSTLIMQKRVQLTTLVLNKSSIQESTSLIINYPLVKRKPFFKCSQLLRTDTTLFILFVLIVIINCAEFVM